MSMVVVLSHDVDPIAAKSFTSEIPRKALVLFTPHNPQIKITDKNRRETIHIEDEHVTDAGSR